MQAANNEGDVSGDDQAVQCFLVRLYRGTAFTPSPLNCAGGGAYPLPQHGERPTLFLQPRLRPLFDPERRLSLGRREGAALGAARSGARRAGGDDGAALGGSASGGPSAAKRRF